MRFHSLGFVQLDREIQAGHTCKLIVSLTLEHIPCFRTGRHQESIEVVKTSGDRLPGELARVYKLITPFAHLSSTFGADVILSTASMKVISVYKILILLAVALLKSYPQDQFPTL